MRWIFFALVFVNLLLLAVFWQQQNLQQAPLVEGFEVSDSSKRIQLISELERPLVELVAKPDQAEKRPRSCYVAGPYVDDIDARHLLARGEALGLDGFIKTVEIEIGRASCRERVCMFV